MKTILPIVLSAWLLAWGSMSSPACAQSALERLERQIREGAGASKSIQADADKPAAAPPTQTPHAPGNAEPGYLGVVADDQKDRGRGVRLLDVYRGSPAENAGLLRQDLVTAIAGTRVRQMTDMSDMLGTIAAGQSVDFELLREGKPQKVRVTLGQRPAAERSAGLPETVPLPPGQPLPEPPEQPADVAATPRRPPPPPDPAARQKGADEPAGPRLQPPGGGLPPRLDASRIEQLQRRLDELERRVAELERAMAKTVKNKP
jgi:hypothetical protein